MRSAVIFGGAGYIGTRWALRLVQRAKFDRVLLADIRQPTRVLPAGVEFRQCDVRKSIQGQLPDLQPDWIFNFAAIHREPGHRPAEYFDTNIPGARHVCAWAETAGCSQILFSSSISVYGPTRGATSESSPLYPSTPYGISKLCAELIHEAWLGAGQKRRLIICRPGVIYGPGDPGNILRMIRAVRRGYFFFPGSTAIRKSYGYIEGLLESFEFSISLTSPCLRFNYVEAETETIGDLVKIIRRQFRCNAPVISFPLWLLQPLAQGLQLVSNGRSPIHPARVRKAATPTHIVPERLKELGFQFRFDFRSSLDHWQAKAPKTSSPLNLPVLWGPFLDAGLSGFCCMQPSLLKGTTLAGQRADSKGFRLDWLASSWGLLLAGLSGLWLMFFFTLRAEWEINAQYNYGYVVRLLGLALFYRRWPEKPAARPGSHGIVIACGLGLLLLFLPLRLVLEANPEWRLMYWLNGFLMLGLSFCVLGFVGGWSWVRCFSPPLLFMLIAVPWPMEFELWAIQGLMRLVASLTCEVVGWLGIAAVQHGNLIEVGVGIVGIDEACSGVRSMQSSLMLSLFLGETYRFSPLRRVVLVAASFLFVLVANLTRTTFLVWAAANRGLHQMEVWHDLAGILVMVIVLPGLLALAYLMKPKELRVPAVGGEAFSAPTLPVWPGLIVLMWALATLLGTESWYRFHESKLIPNVRWSLNWPSASEQFRKTTLPANSLAILRCSKSEAAAWQDEQGNQWSAFMLRWEPGRNSTQLAKGHRPDICLPASGAKLREDFGEMHYQSGDLSLSFRHQTFENGDKLLHVFYCLWSERRAPTELSLPENGTRAGRMEAVGAGKRNLGQQVLEIVLIGPETREEAEEVLNKELPSLIRANNSLSSVSDSEQDLGQQ